MAFQFLKAFDIYGYRFNIQYKGEISYKTIIGGVTTIISIIVMLLSLITFGQNFIKKLNPRIFPKQIKLKKEYTSHLNNTNTIFGFRIEGLAAEDILNNKYFTTEAYLTLKNEKDKNAHPYRRNISLMNCTEVSEQVETVFNDIETEFIENGLCLNLTMDTDDPNLMWPLEAHPSQEIHIKLHCGSKNKEGKNCLNDDNFRQRFFKKNFLLYFQETSLDYDDINYPFLRKIEQDFMFVNPVMAKYINLLYSNVAVESDLGFLFSDLYLHNNVNLERVLHNYMINSDTSDANNKISLISVKINFSDSVGYIKRVYDKLQNVFAEVGGIINSIILISRLSVFFFSKSLFFENLINDIFHNYHAKDDDAELKKAVSRIDKNINIDSENINVGGKGRQKIGLNGKGDIKSYLIDKYKKRRNQRSIVKFKNDVINIDHEAKTCQEKNLDPNYRKREKLDKESNLSHFTNPNSINFKEKINNEKTPSKYISSLKKIKDEERSMISNRSNLYLLKNKDRLNEKRNNLNISSDFHAKKNLHLEVNNRTFPNNINDSQDINIKDSSAKAEKVENLPNKASDNSLKDKIIAEKLVITKKQKVKVTCKSLIMSLLCPNKFLNEEIKANNNTFKMFSKELNKLLELDSIIHCKKNIDLLKILLFNENQRKAIDYVEFEFENNEIDSRKDLEAIIHYFRTKNGDLLKKDYKILELLNNDIFSFYEDHDFQRKKFRKKI